MINHTFMQKLTARWNRGNFVCIGLDSRFQEIPISVYERCINVVYAMLAFNEAIIEATKEVACAYKLNSAFYEAYGEQGFQVLRHTISCIHNSAPEVPVILDAKRGDVEHANDSYALSIFHEMRADAVTVNPYLGGKALRQFLKYKDMGIFVVCGTSNTGANEFQGRMIMVSDDEIKTLVNDVNIFKGLCDWKKIDIATWAIPLYQFVALQVDRHWNANGNCCLVMGATTPKRLEAIRHLVPELPILIPGIGAQGGNLEKVVLSAKNRHGNGFIINSSRGIIFASSGQDFAEVAGKEAKRLNDLIVNYRR